MDLTQPIGNSNFAPFLVRVPLGAYVFLDGMQKIENHSRFIQTLESMRGVPEHLATVAGILIPYLEVGAGALLVLGMWTILAGVISTLIFAFLVYLAGTFPSSGSKLFNKDLLLVGASASLLYTGAGAFSVDAIKKPSKA